MLPKATHDNNIDSKRRRFLTVAGAASAVAAGTLAAAAAPSATACLMGDDRELLQLEAQIFDARSKAKVFDPEIEALSEIWESELNRLERESTMTPPERWDLVRQMDASKEHDRVSKLQRPYYDAYDTMLEKFLATPATSPEGRRAKVNVLLGCIWDDWLSLSGDDEDDFPIRVAKDLLIEFCGEPGEKLRAEFA